MHRAVAGGKVLRMPIANEYWEDYEVLTVETPENLELRLPLAGFGPRFLAVFIDNLIQGLVAAVLIGIAIAVMGASMANAGDPDMSMVITIAVVAVILSILVTLGYFVFFEWLWNGQTPGKRTAGIRVVRRGGLPLTFSDVLLRNLFRLIDMLPSNGFVGLVSFFATSHQQRLGDLVADTVVIREFASQTPYPWAGNLPDKAGAGAQGLPAQLSYVIGSYLQRAFALPVEVRLTITEQVISRLGYRADELSLAEREAYLAHVLDWRQGARQ
jgi:uncharacterized RDD family membrane protein YckC